MNAKDHRTGDNNAMTKSSHTEPDHLHAVGKGKSNIKRTKTLKMMIQRNIDIYKR